MLIDVWSGLLLVNLTATLGLIGLTCATFQRQAAHRPLAGALFALELDLVVWTSGRLLSYFSSDYAGSYFWLRVSFAGFCLFGPCVVALALATGGFERFLRLKWIAAIIAPGALFLLADIFDDWHRLFFSSVTRLGGASPTLYSPGPLFWLSMLVFTVYLAGAALLFVLAYRGSAGLVNRGTTLMIGMILLSGLTDMTALPWVSDSPIAITSLSTLGAVVVCALAQMRYWLLDDVRVALAQAAEQVGDAIVVLDLENRILDANPVFCSIVKESRQEMLGHPLSHVAAGLRNRVVDLDGMIETISKYRPVGDERVSRDVRVEGPSGLIYELSVWPILGPGKEMIARMALLRDVTETRAATESLREAIGDLEALHQTALAMTSLQDLDVILGLILKDVSRLAEAEAAQIAILDRAGKLYTTLAHIEQGDRFALSPISRRPGPLSQRIFQERQALFVEDVDGEGALRSSSMDESVRSYAGLPLTIRDRLVGVMYLTYHQPHSFSAANRRLIQTFASYAAVAILNAQMFDEISRAATIDSLTELLNHRHLMQRLDEELARARRSGHPLTVMMIDVDDFKLVNDAHGHTVGDEILRLVANVLRDTFRATDIIGRYGGDEFLVLLPETDGHDAAQVAERLVSAIRATEFVLPKRNGRSKYGGNGVGSSKGQPHPAGMAIPIRLSVGLAVYPVDSASRLELVSLADAAMYCSKRSGSNTVTLAHATDSGFLASQNSTFSVLEGLVNAVDGKDRYTRAHSEQVAQYALSLAAEIGLSDEERRRLRIAGLLHDVGKIGIPDRILRKPGPLDEEERNVVQQHPLLSEMIMREIPQMTDVLEAVRHHHEWYDGRGYPRGLQDGEIPILSRVIAVADAYSAMILDRPYRRALSVEEAIKELRAGAGTQFDPALVEAFVRCLMPEPDNAAADNAVPVS